MLDYLNSDSEEVKTVLTQLSEAKQALQQAKDNYRPSVRDERYLTGEEVCRYLHASRRAHSKPCVIHGRFPLPLSAGGYFFIPRVEYERLFIGIYSLSKNRFNPSKRANPTNQGHIGLNIPCVPGLLLPLLSLIYNLGTNADQRVYYTSAIPYQ